MKITEYVKLIDKTKKYPQKVDNFGIVYCYLGLMEEYQEFLEKVENFSQNTHTSEDILNIYKEAGDVCWYITALSLELELNVENIFNLDDRSTIIVDYRKFPQVLKKFYRDNKPIDLKWAENILQSWVSSIIHCCDYITNITKSDIDFEDILDMNYEKLLSRLERGVIHGDGDNR